jgi:regulator of replication initiation timing
MRCFQQHEEAVRSAALAADVQSLQHQLELADESSAPNSTVQCPTSQPLGGAVPSCAMAYTAQPPASSQLVAKTIVTARRRATMENAHVSAISEHIDKIRMLSETIAEKDKDISELQRDKRALKEQYELLTLEHNDVLARMSHITNAPSSAEVPQESALNLRLSAAQDTIVDLKEQIAESTKRVVELQEVWLNIMEVYLVSDTTTFRPLVALPLWQAWSPLAQCCPYCADRYKLLCSYVRFACWCTEVACFRAGQDSK